jgi:hypothetical protein
VNVAREWAIPLALGIVVAAGLWALPDDNDGGPPDASSDDPPIDLAPDPVLLFPFESPRIVDEPAQVLVISRLDQPLGIRPRDNISTACAYRITQTNPPCEGYGIDWRTPRVGFLNTSGPPSDPPGSPYSSCDCGGPGIHLHAAEGSPRLGLNGYNATRATIYVFDERGLLAATNDEHGNWSRFAGSPTTMESAVWYIGANSTAPNGTEKPPSFAAPLVQKLRPLMEGLPVGGVTSTQSNAYVSLYGTLFITIRIDELVYAP